MLTYGDLWQTLPRLRLEAKETCSVYQIAAKLLELLGAVLET